MIHQQIRIFAQQEIFYKHIGSLHFVSSLPAWLGLIEKKLRLYLQLIPK
jgi:hypothetical protein